MPRATDRAEPPCSTAKKAAYGAAAAARKAPTNLPRATGPVTPATVAKPAPGDRSVAGSGGGPSTKVDRRVIAARSISRQPFFQSIGLTVGMEKRMTWGPRETRKGQRRPPTTMDTRRQAEIRGLRAENIAAGGRMCASWPDLQALPLPPDLQIRTGTSGAARLPQGQDEFGRHGAGLSPCLR